VIYLKIMNKRVVFAFILGFVLALVFFHLFKKEKTKGEVTSFNNHFEPPYYEKKVFQLPKELEKKASVSATLKIPIIMYHYVEYIKDVEDLIKKRLDINPDLFEGQLKALKEASYKTYFVREIPDILEGKIEYSSRSAVLTFDDGYKDFYTVVFPLLKKYQMKATIYVIANFIGKPGFMNEKEIKEVLDSGLVELGSHTLDHLYLKLIPQTVARKQIFESKKVLEEKFKVKVETFAYPYGAFSKKTVDLVKEAGYKAAVSVIPSMIQSEENLFYLSRVRPGIFTPKTMIKVIESYRK
jgi:peptidoglycan/xylan/chitin deacetylase (PgdA/CDA1 family)